MAGAHPERDCRPWSLERARVLGPYRPPFATVVHALKYEHKTILARPVGEALAALVESDPAMISADSVCPIPLHPARQRERGYNQAQLLARWVAEETGKELCELLVRRRNTPTQTRTASPALRRSSVRGAFALRPGVTVSGRSVIIVDDVITTGATLDEAGRCLLKGGATRLFGLAVAGA